MQSQRLRRIQPPVSTPQLTQNVCRRGSDEFSRQCDARDSQPLAQGQSCDAPSSFPPVIPDTAHKLADSRLLLRPNRSKPSRVPTRAYVPATTPPGERKTERA